MILPESGQEKLLWYKDSIIYQLHVKSFYDSKGDGIGDFAGLARKLDYLESIGITAIWLLPFYKSPLKDDGYDISDYKELNSSYGTIADFRHFLNEAHRRGIKIITELVLNHTSDQHIWFQRSRQAPSGSYWRNFYVWSDSNDKYRGARIIFKDYEISNWTWDPIAQSYYWHRFYSHQPDLNFENPEVHKELYKIVNYWFGLGVDGLRLDAIPYLYEQEGTNCENLPPTFEFIKNLRKYVDKRFPDKVLLAEANQWPEDAVKYLGQGDMCHMAFHFPLMPRMFLALQMEDRFPIVDILEQTPSIPDNTQWAIFLRNHDELTLEMVSEEERDLMYRAYAHDSLSRINLGIRRRLAPLLQNSRRRLELMNILLFSLPGTPIIYYGDEIGMGDNHFLGDRDGVRTPMQWTPDRNAGFSQCNPQQLFLPIIIDPEYHYETINVENEEQNLHSLLWWTRRVIALRRKYLALSRGKIEFVKSENPRVLTFIRKHGEEVVLVIVNLSRFSQAASLDLSSYAGMTPFDVFSNNKFPRISASPYNITLGFHDYFWFHLRAVTSSDLKSAKYITPDFSVRSTWLEIFSGSHNRRLETIVLPRYLEQRTTSGCRGFAIQQVTIVDHFNISNHSFNAVILFLSVRYANGEHDTLILPLASGSEEEVNKIIGDDKGLVLAMIDSGNTGVVYDCGYHPLFHQQLLKVLQGRKQIPGYNGVIRAVEKRVKKGLFQEQCQNVKLVKAGRRNTCFAYDDKIFLKVFRRAEEGENPDIVIPKLLSATLNQKGISPTFLNGIVYKTKTGGSYHVAVAVENITETKTLLEHAVESATRFLEKMLALRVNFNLESTTSLLNQPEISDVPLDSHFFGLLTSMGQITAQMHQVLGKAKDSNMYPEPYDYLYQRSLYQSVRSQIKRITNVAKTQFEGFSDEIKNSYKTIIDREKDIISLFMSIMEKPYKGSRIRVHGDYCLDQLLVKGDKLIICDFEGRPEVSLSERILKRSPLYDIAAMAHSLHYVAYSCLYEKLGLQSKDRQLIEPWAAWWGGRMSEAFVSEYRKSISEVSFIPKSDRDLTLLTLFYLCERSIFETNAWLAKDKKTFLSPSICLQLYLKYLFNEVSQAKKSGLSQSKA